MKRLGMLALIASSAVMVGVYALIAHFVATSWIAFALVGISGGIFAAFLIWLALVTATTYH